MNNNSIRFIGKNERLKREGYSERERAAAFELSNVDNYRKYLAVHTMLAKGLSVSDAAKKAGMSETAVRAISSDHRR